MCNSRSRIVIRIAAIWLVAATASAQVVRLPTVAPEDSSYPGSLVSHPGSAAELLQAPGNTGLPEQSERPADARPGMFQKLITSGEWLAGSGDNFGSSRLEMKSILALPIPSREYPLIVTPGFAVRYFDGPASRDLPPRVYDAYAQFRWMRRLGGRWGIDLAITPGAFGDFEQSNDDTFRLTGHGVAAWTWTPTTKLVLGAAYIDRFSTAVLPVCGIIWNPHDDAKYELVFPHPRIARRIYWFGAYGETVQDWIYLAGELGGGTWAIRRTSGASDLVDYTDYRLFLGVERKILFGVDWRLEVGYVFGRKLRYQSPTPELRPNGTFMVRAQMTY